MVVVLVILVVLVLLSSGCGGGDGPPAQSSPSAEVGSPSAAPTLGRATPLTERQQIGQRLIVGYPGVAPPRSVLEAAREGRIGGVILYRANVPTVGTARRNIARLQAAARRGGQPALLVLTDQEGGVVKRFPDLPPTLSAAQVGARPQPAATARRQGQLTGRALREIGITVDLAPVVDVPDRARTFLTTRAYAQDPADVARAACAFAAGLNQAGVAATLKHFPGLGRARGDTDIEHVSVMASRAELRADLAPYTRCAGTSQLAMVSSGRYPALGIRRPAAIAPRTYALLEQVGFTGLSMTDAVETPAFAGLTRPDRLAINAGADLLVYAHDPERAARAYADLVADQQAGRLHPPRSDFADAITALKRRLAAGGL
jgi:beta-N-acetylhexosaminidase